VHTVVRAAAALDVIPESVAMDGGFASKSNLSTLKTLGGAPLCAPPNGTQMMNGFEPRIDYQDRCRSAAQPAIVRLKPISRQALVS
jgi:hypothetical protein